MEVDTGCRIDPITDLVGIGRHAEATRGQLLRLTLWLATSIRDSRAEIKQQVDQGPLTWAPVRLHVSNVQFDESCLDAEVQVCAAYRLVTRDRQTKIERDGSLIGIVNQGRFLLLEAECKAQGHQQVAVCEMKCKTA